MCAMSKLHLAKGCHCKLPHLEAPLTRKLCKSQQPEPTHAPSYVFVSVSICPRSAAGEWYFAYVHCWAAWRCEYLGGDDDRYTTHLAWLANKSGYA